MSVQRTVEVVISDCVMNLRDRAAVENAIDDRIAPAKYVFTRSVRHLPWNQTYIYEVVVEDPPPLAPAVRPQFKGSAIGYARHASP